MELPSIDGRKIQIVAGIHGNERAAVRALTDSGCDFVLGNPRAFEADTRYIDADLNASFGVTDDTYESQRAAELLKMIDPESFVIDFHTTSAETEPFVILTDSALIPHAKLTGLRHIVLMKYNVKGAHALINHRDGISIEISGYDTHDAYDTVRSVLHRMAEQRQEADIAAVYEVIGKITTPGTYRNFQKAEDGTYPVLVGEKAYDFIGLAARRIG